MQSPCFEIRRFNPMLKPRFNPKVFEHRGHAHLNLLKIRTIVSKEIGLYAQNRVRANHPRNRSDVAA
jgi:hypothetical protein